MPTTMGVQILSMWIVKTCQSLVSFAIGEEVTVPRAHSAVEGLLMTTNPRLMPESESTVFMAFHNRLAGTHTGG